LRDTNRENKELELHQKLLDFVKQLVPPFDGRPENARHATRQSE